MRSSEILELKYTDIHFTPNSITIDSRKNRAPNRLTHFMLNDECMEIFSRLRNTYPNDIFVFQSRNSRNQKNKPASPVSRQFVTKGFKSASDSISLPITISSLRHNYAIHMSLTSSKQVDHKYLSEILGHNTKSMTERYIHKGKASNPKEFLPSPKANLNRSDKKNEIESLLNGEISDNSIGLSDIAKKYSISECDLRTTLKTLRIMTNYI
jgi:integrase